MFDSNILLTKFGPGFWSRVPAVGPGFYSFPKPESSLRTGIKLPKAAVTSGLSDIQNHDGYRGDATVGEF